MYCVCVFAAPRGFAPSCVLSNILISCHLAGPSHWSSDGKDSASVSIRTPPVSREFCVTSTAALFRSALLSKHGSPHPSPSTHNPLWSGVISCSWMGLHEVNESTARGSLEIVVCTELSRFSRAARYNVDVIIIMLVLPPSSNAGLCAVL